MLSVGEKKLEEGSESLLSFVAPVLPGWDDKGPSDLLLRRLVAAPEGHHAEVEGPVEVQGHGPDRLLGRAARLRYQLFDDLELSDAQLGAARRWCRNRNGSAAPPLPRS